MKTIGLIGGVSWESSKTYYAYINRLTRDRLGGLNSAPMVLMSLNLADVEPLLSADDWQGVAEIVCAAGKRAEDAGAEALFIASNTLNRVQPELAAHVGIPCFHIARATGEALARDNRKKIGLIATRFTIEQGFHAEILAKEFNIETIVPDQQDIAALNQIILEELCMGIVNDKSRPPLPRRHGTPNRPRCRSHHPRLHRNRNAGQTRTHKNPPIRHNKNPRHLCSGLGVGVGE